MSLRFLSKADRDLPLLIEGSHDILGSVTERKHEQAGRFRPGYAGPPSS
jgi:hypothetical protein